MVLSQGFEPQLEESKSSVLPLDEPRMERWMGFEPMNGGLENHALTTRVITANDDDDRYGF